MKAKIVEIQGKLALALSPAVTRRAGLRVGDEVEILSDPSDRTFQIIKHGGSSSPKSETAQRR